MSHRGHWSFFSMRLKRTNPKEDKDESHYIWHRGIKRFSSLQSYHHKSEAVSEVNGKVEQQSELKHRQMDNHSHWGADMSGEDVVDKGRLHNRFSVIFSSIRRKISRTGSVKESEQPLKGEPAVVNATLRDTRYANHFFFEYLVVVKIQKKKSGGYEPQISYQFPKRDGMLRFQKEEEEKTLKAITLFCFPEGIDWAPLTEYRSETFSFVLTEMDGSRRNGYCRRLLPHGNGARLPEAYCIVSQLACFGLFSKIFDEVEKRRQISTAMIYPFMQSLRETPFPAPGHTVNIKSFIPESGTEIIALTRPVDSWLEHVDFQPLFDCLSDTEVLQVFAATALERRVIFLAEELSTLSQVINAVTALLYPFIWQHTLISIVPQILLTVTMAPTPFLLGVQKHFLDSIMEEADQNNLLVVDLSQGANKKFLVQVGDEANIVPCKLQEEILQALSVRTDKSSPEQLKRVVSEAFVTFFVKTVGHFASYVRQPGGEFQRRRFYKAVESKSVRHFVKRFTQTQMFDLFIQEVDEPQAGAQGGFFHRKVAEYQERSKKEKSRRQ